MEHDLNLVLEKLASIEKSIKDLNINSKEILCFDEACNFLDLSKSYLYKLTSKGEISFYRPHGKKIYFERKGLLEWIMRNRSSANYELLLKASQIERP